MQVYLSNQDVGFIPAGSLFKQDESGDFLVSVPHDNNHNLKCAWKGDLKLSSEYVKTLADQSLHPVHDWWVISTVLSEGALLVKCMNFDLTGLVHNPTREEWNAAFNAPGHHYRWADDHRVAYYDNDDDE